MTEHRWNTKEYEDRLEFLKRTELHKLYPSEAWCLYRLIPECATVVDLGCGDGAMAEICRQINPTISYTGMDHQVRLMAKAREVLTFAHFESADMLEYLSRRHKYDLVMSWSVVKSFAKWRDVISGMLSAAQKYVVFDLRISNTDAEIFDNSYSWAEYGGIKSPILIINYERVISYLKSLPNVKRIEVAGYQSVTDPHAFCVNPNLEMFVFTFVIFVCKADDHPQEIEIYEQLPKNLLCVGGTAA